LGYFQFAFLGEESNWAAQASECAADQNAFWEYHDLLFESQKGENQGAFNQDNLKQFAMDLGLDSKTFDECMDTGKYASAVQSQTAMAQQLGVRSTPSFVINGQAVIGAQPFENFKQIIDSLLAGQ
jgi:protein-disulfide isomerase